MGRTRARLFAVAMVLGSTVGTALALRVWPDQFDGPQSNPSIPPNGSGRIVFSIRNDQGGPISIDAFMKQMAGSGSALPDGCSQMSLPVRMGGSGTLPYGLAYGSQAQFVVQTTTPFATAGDYSCTYDIITTPSTGATVTATFHVQSGPVFDVQPKKMDFGSATNPNSEYQTVLITNYGTNQTVTLTVENDALNHFMLAGCSPGGSSCSVATSGSGSGSGGGSASVHCRGITNNYGSGALVVKNSSNQEVARVLLECFPWNSTPTIDITPNPLYIYAPQGQVGSGNLYINSSVTQFTSSMTIMGSNSNGPFEILQCDPGLGCPVQQIPSGITVLCTPDSGSASGTVSVFGGSGGMDAATVYCIPSSTGPLLVVSPTNLAFPNQNVGSMGSAFVRVENQGGQSLTNVALTFPGTGGQHWYTDQCSASSPCTLAPAGYIDVPIWFRPLAHGVHTTMMEVDAAQHGTPLLVDLQGSGFGGVMTVTQPSAANSYHLDLGTIPVGQTTTSNITLRNDGNLVYTATLMGVAPPYSVTPTTENVPESMSRNLVVSCGSNAASPTNDQTWAIQSDAYAGSAQQITVGCSIADTFINVDPLMFDFGEVRTGSPAQNMTVTVSNPSTSPAQVHSMQLRTATPGLSLVPPMTMTTLQGGSAATAVLALATGSDTDLDGQFIDIAVDNATLALPVRGKVVTPHSRVVPAALDLGTACTGTQVSGTVRLVNDGTATLAVEPPQMAQQSFLAATPGTIYPLELPAGMGVTAEVSPALSTSGVIEDTLTWQDDVPNTYEVPVTLEYVTTGTALSPRALDFGIVKVDDGPTATQRITLENCDLAARSITVKAIRGLRGPTGVWKLEPRVGYTKQLATHEKQAINVAFEPPARGRFEAELIVEGDNGTQTILLVGEATGRDFPETSFYACACNAPGAPWRGWPVGLALLVIVRRRRGPSSAR